MVLLRNLLLFNVLILTFPLISVSYVYDYTSITRETVGCGRNELRNITHTRYHYEIPLGASVRLRSCEGFRYNLTTRWFVLSDFCRSIGLTQYYFASIHRNGTALCDGRSPLKPLGTCEQNFVFTNGSVLISNLSDSIPTEYMCWYSETNLADIASLMSHSIRIIDTTDQDITENSTTSSELVTDNNVTISTANTTLPLEITTPNTPLKRWILTIVLPASVLFVVLLIAITIGYVHYRRCRLRQAEENMQMEILK